MSRPGFAVLLYHSDTRSAQLIKTGYNSNTSYFVRRKGHGQILCEIAQMFGRYMTMAKDGFVVREKAFSRFARETQTLNKVVGVTDMLLWSGAEKSFIELTPSEIKKYVTGNARAEKEEVAAALPPYLGEHNYTVDDESDAAATALAFLIREGYVDSLIQEQKGVDPNDA